MAAYRDALGLDRIGAGDDFFELGGDSLSAVEMLAIASETFEVELTVADLLEAPTPAALAARAHGAGPRNRRDLIHLQEGNRRPVFVVPGGGGEDLFAARRIARSTGGGFPFFCFRPGPPPHPPAPELAARFIGQLRAASPRGPYALVGDCIGGIVAFAMARQLRRDGDEVALLALLDTPFPTRARRSGAWLKRHAPRAVRLFGRIGYFRERFGYHAGVLRGLEGGRLAYLRRVGGVGVRSFLPDPNPRRLAHLDRRASYVGAAMGCAPGRYDGRVLLVESEEWARRGYSTAWSRLSADSEVVRVCGDHAGFILDHETSVGAALRRALEAAG